jgi:hypothetical protein
VHLQLGHARSGHVEGDAGSLNGDFASRGDHKSLRATINYGQYTYNASTVIKITPRRVASCVLKQFFTLIKLSGLSERQRPALTW